MQGANRFMGWQTCFNPTGLGRSLLHRPLRVVHLVGILYATHIITGKHRLRDSTDLTLTCHVFTHQRVATLVLQYVSWTAFENC
jgi:hypothetical protein